METSYSSENNSFLMSDSHFVTVKISLIARTVNAKLLFLSSYLPLTQVGFNTLSCIFTSLLKYIFENLENSSCDLTPNSSPSC